MKIILIVHLVSTLFMTGLCWFVQIVHYPLFRVIENNKFSAYERKNAITGIITVPVMIIELISGLVLIYHFQDGLHLLNIALLTFIWLSTMIFQVPIHFKLMQEASPELITKVIKTNWIRTLSWTVRTVLLSYLIWTLLQF